MIVICPMKIGFYWRIKNMSQTLRSYHRKRIKRLLFQRGKISYYQLMQNYMKSCLTDFEIAIKTLQDENEINIIFENEIPYYYIGTLETEIVDVEKEIDDWWEEESEESKEN